VPKKNSGGLFGSLTMKQTDALAIRLSNGAAAAKEYDTAMEIHEVVDDLHNSWMARADAGEYPATSVRARRS
jgi:hypothetical protein